MIYHDKGRVYIGPTLWEVQSASCEDIDGLYDDDVDLWEIASGKVPPGAWRRVSRHLTIASARRAMLKDYMRENSDYYRISPTRSVIAAGICRGQRAAKKESRDER